MTSRSLRLSLLLLVAITSAALLGCGSIATRPAVAARGIEIGIQDDPVFVRTGSGRALNRERGYRLIAPLGVSRLRINVSWANVLFPEQRNLRRRPQTIEYQFGLYDQAIDTAARHGIRVQLTLTGQAPAFATHNHRIGVNRPSASLFADFAAAAAHHFRGRVDRYEIWNEPNWHTWLSPLRAAPGLYRRLYSRAYNAIKAQDPGAKVLFGETVPYGQPGRSIAPLSFLRRALCVNRHYRRKGHCPGLRADGYAHHPYDFLHAAHFRYPGKDNVTIGTLGRLTRALDRLSRIGALRKTGHGRLPLYLTEYGYFGKGHRSLPARKRIRYLKQGWTIALRNRRVKENVQYLLAAPRRGDVGAFFDLALLTTRGHKRPNYRALQSWFRAHRGKVKHKPASITLPPVPSS
jgi:hypothetical protein